jgi:hypothetical protein
MCLKKALTALFGGLVRSSYNARRPIEGSHPVTKAGRDYAGSHQHESIELFLCDQQARDIVRKGHERRQGKRREFCALRDISEYVAEMRDAGVDLEREVAALD